MDDHYRKLERMYLAARNGWLLIGALDEAGFAVDLEVIRSHDHDYYARSKKVNQAAWEFLRQHRIER